MAWSFFFLLGEVEDDTGGDEVLLSLGGTTSSPGIPGVSPKVDIIYVISVCFFLTDDRFAFCCCHANAVCCCWWPSFLFPNRLDWNAHVVAGRDGEKLAGGRYLVWDIRLDCKTDWRDQNKGPANKIQCTMMTLNCCCSYLDPGSSY